MAAAKVEEREAGLVLYDDTALQSVEEDWFLESYWRERNLVVDQVSGRGSVLFVEGATGVWVLRHYRRGGFVARFIEDSYLWMGLERTRAFREWRLLHELTQRGLPVPLPIAAHVARNGTSYRADIITMRIPNTRPWASIVGSGDAESWQWEQIGLTLRRFHDEGVDHADLNAHNILIDDERRVFLVDFDRGRLRRRGGWQSRNIARLLRSLRKISLETGVTFDDAGWWNLVSSYRSGR